uniref:Uncharacterized protein n=1 Tax=Noctiluca scintillans TaxID=2966 RepID=A0A7S1A5Z6_NOCSC|mmetsp:Transcript_33075/g.88649  ORF Transcript_33075/g.88649 Transcript_33075/m.88649 type:complete len:188 (+) Transcript_33075:52-615(+)
MSAGLVLVKRPRRWATPSARCASCLAGFCTWGQRVLEFALVASYMKAFDWVWRNPFCNMCFSCGCWFNWAGWWGPGGTTYCNVHNKHGPQCPWCIIAMTWSPVWLFLGNHLVVAVCLLAWVHLLRKRVRIGCRTVLPMAVWFVYSFVSALIFFMGSDYPYFLMFDLSKGWRPIDWNRTNTIPDDLGM